MEFKDTPQDATWRSEVRSFIDAELARLGSAGTDPEDCGSARY